MTGKTGSYRARWITTDKRASVDRTDQLPDGRRNGWPPETVSKQGFTPDNENAKEWISERR
jgi:hypothetical protein